MGSAGDGKGGISDLLGAKKRLLLAGIVVVLAAVAMVALIALALSVLFQIPLDPWLKYLSPFYLLYLLLKPVIDIFAMLLGMAVSFFVWMVSGLEALPDAFDRGFEILFVDIIWGFIKIFLLPFEIMASTLGQAFNDIGEAFGSMLDFGDIFGKAFGQMFDGIGDAFGSLFDFGDIFSDLFDF